MHAKTNVNRNKDTKVRILQRYGDFTAVTVFRFTGSGAGTGGERIFDLASGQTVNNIKLNRAGTGNTMTFGIQNVNEDCATLSGTVPHLDHSRGHVPPDYYWDRAVASRYVSIQNRMFSRANRPYRLHLLHWPKSLGNRRLPQRPDRGPARGRHATQ